ncbi:LapA family protein [Agrococcus jenensis]|uniref:Putative integral membrane protein n=1 Tax=Agrococcus jenensis TaxID=46353 RepID=A0A3N2ARH0_9MICO|nr:LapA family protein [Agrococcus jenensis]ROR65312.1 putative integral membrane protein [Agrococcus jenensis]
MSQYDDPNAARRADADGDGIPDRAETERLDDRAQRDGATASDTSTDRSATTRDASTQAAPTAVEPKRVTLDPSLDSHQRQGVTGGTWIALILGTLILVLLLIFILQNNVPADFAYFGFAFNLPLGVAMLFAAIAGVLIAALLGSVRLFKLSRRVRKLEKERETIKRAIR